MKITNEKACLTPRSSCYVPLAAAIAPKESQGEGVYYALRGGNHVMHFRQSHWKKLVLGAITRNIEYIEKGASYFLKIVQFGPFP